MLDSLKKPVDLTTCGSTDKLSPEPNVDKYRGCGDG